MEKLSEGSMNLIVEELLLLKWIFLILIQNQTIFNVKIEEGWLNPHLHLGFEKYKFLD